MSPSPCTGHTKSRTGSTSRLTALGFSSMHSGVCSGHEFMDSQAHATVVRDAVTCWRKTTDRREGLHRAKPQAVLGA